MRLVSAFPKAADGDRELHVADYARLQRRFFPAVVIASAPAGNLTALVLFSRCWHVQPYTEAGLSFV